MKDKIIIIMIPIILIATTALIILLNKTHINNNSKLIYVGDFEEKIIEEENYVITNYKDYVSKFNSNDIKEQNFKDHNYAVISIPYNPCSESDITPTNYIINDNNIDVIIKYKASCGFCATRNIYYLLELDKEITDVNIYIDHKATNNPNCNYNVTDKPLIYLYPEKETEVTIKLGKPDLLTTTYPKYKNEWKILAKPNGDIIDESNRTYYGLYWESKNKIKCNFKDGFVVSGENTIPFLEEKLQILGLTEKEANEFIVYWLPILEKNKYNIIRFEEIEEINKQMPLDINPIPDTIIRILMEYKSVSEKIDIKEQELTPTTRKGFTVVEWGGTLINN